MSFPPDLAAYLAADDAPSGSVSAAPVRPGWQGARVGSLVGRVVRLARRPVLGVLRRARRVLGRLAGRLPLVRRLPLPGRAASGSAVASTQAKPPALVPLEPFTQAVPGAPRADTGWQVTPAGLPEADQTGQNGARLKVRRRDGGLLWAVRPGAPGQKMGVEIPGVVALDRVAGGAASGTDGQARRVYAELAGHGPAGGELAVTWLDAAGQVIPGSWYAWNQRHAIAVPPAATHLRLALRAPGEGFAQFTAVRLARGAVPAALPETTSPDRVLLISDDYPDEGDLYKFGFVHTRVKAYQARGLQVDVMVMRPGWAKAERTFQGVTVWQGSDEWLRDLLDSGRYGHVLVHFLKPYLWEVLRAFTHRVPITLWVHGSDIQPWWRHKHLIDGPDKQAWYEQHTERLMAMWREVLSDAASQVRFVFVSKAFEGEVSADLAQFGLALPEGRTAVIHNAIDTDLFEYREKDPEQRKRILMIRTFKTRKYGTDLAAAAIGELVSEPWFGELEFLLVGDGALWEEDTAGLQGLANVTFRRDFLTHPQIAELQLEYGVMLQPTRWDSQGVSRDEAMSSGLVVISNRVAAVPEFLSEAEGYLAEPDDAHGIAEAMRELYGRPDLFEAKSRAAAARVRRELALDVVIPQEIALIRAPLGEGDAGPGGEPAAPAVPDGEPAA